MEYKELKARLKIIKSSFLDIVEQIEEIESSGANLLPHIFTKDGDYIEYASGILELIKTRAGWSSRRLGSIMDSIPRTKKNPPVKSESEKPVKGRKGRPKGSKNKEKKSG